MASPRPALQRNGSSPARLNPDLEELNRIGIALFETRDVGGLVSLILAKAREITCADAGFLYLVERMPATLGQSGAPTDPGNASRLRFTLMQNDSVPCSNGEHTLLPAEDSIAGYCALHGEIIELADAYRIPSGLPYKFDASFDEKSGYRTRSLVALPMKNGTGEVLGVLQLLNFKRDPKAKLTTQTDMRRQVRPFPAAAVRLGLWLASQAAVAYENSELQRDIISLFDGFVSAAVKAVEQRDPTTSGHSQRVCSMTLALAETVDRQTSGAYAGVRFLPEQMKELRYAALLHDFGNVGVREEVLVKARKLYPLQFSRLIDRFDYIHKEAEVRFLRQTLEALLSLPQNRAEISIRQIDEEGARFFDELDRYVEFLRKANEPAALPAGELATLREMAQRTYYDPRGTAHPFLTSEEVRLLSIPRGSLDADERRQIESHAIQSFNFLMQIPWTREYRGVPEIARAHHEKLNGTGYPYGLAGDEIPVQAKMMTVCDIYDALTASDRPYKRAVSAERALDILRLCVRDKQIDSELFRLFAEARIYQLVSKSPRV